MIRQTRPIKDVIYEQCMHYQGSLSDEGGGFPASGHLSDILCLEKRGKSYQKTDV